MISTRRSSTGLQPNSQQRTTVSTSGKTLWHSRDSRRLQRRPRSSSRTRLPQRSTCLTSCLSMVFLSTLSRLSPGPSSSRSATTSSRGPSSLAARPSRMPDSRLPTSTRFFSSAVRPESRRSSRSSRTSSARSLTRASILTRSSLSALRSRAVCSQVMSRMCSFWMSLRFHSVSRPSAA